MLRKDGVTLSGPMLEIHALEIATEHEAVGFKSSWHWQQGVSQRYELSKRARADQKKSAPEGAHDITLGFGI
ncbi:hypothetical protein GN244_ATG13537 [Phytophthora infestans]|uniref:HTH CENPB-type domain-containing protein n=1 Tax=Phytophthora infestans TaxID=4787 RepID=A0A833SKW2_PHYIN|nr:hypothetical protein GN244_ATG13537 [Phytophthora infestans]KAF4149622.1 hypothetical protein GN958_ATG01206 [Phytophthora infestans]